MNNFDSFVNITTGKLNSNAACEDGEYPFFTCSPETLSINTYAFDTEAILLAGNNANGIFPIKYYKGRFNAYQRTYVLTIKDTSKLLYKFLFHYLKTQLEELKNTSYGSATKFLTLPILKSINIPPVCIEEQQAIAVVLSCLDDKIDLLHRQNVTLEAMAEALFRQWFVVEAKEEWDKQPLSAIAHFLNGLACQKYHPRNTTERLPVLKIRELNSGIDQNVDWATNSVSSEYIVTSGDVIFSWSGSLMVKVWAGVNCILNQHLFKVTSKNYPKWFYYFWCKRHLAEFISISESKATTMGHIKRGDLDNAEVLIPTKNKLVMMTDVMQPIWEKATANQTQIHTLEKLRDMLLPKLMNGEARVSY